MHSYLYQQFWHNIYELNNGCDFTTTCPVAAMVLDVQASTTAAHIHKSLMCYEHIMNMSDKKLRGKKKFHYHAITRTSFFRIFVFCIQLLSTENAFDSFARKFNKWLMRQARDWLIREHFWWWCLPLHAGEEAEKNTRGARAEITIIHGTKWRKCIACSPK